MNSLPAGLTIRDTLQPGDLGMLLYLHGLLYARDRGYDFTFEGDIAESIAAFVRNRPAGGSNLWVAEKDGRMAGTVGILRREDGQAQLRWILVHPDCRGLGLGRTLMGLAIEYCRNYGYRQIHLSRVEPTSPARPMYEALGFREVDRVPQTRWGKSFPGIAYILELEQ